MWCCCRLWGAALLLWIPWFLGDGKDKGWEKCLCCLSLPSVSMLFYVFSLQDNRIYESITITTLPLPEAPALPRNKGSAIGKEFHQFVMECKKDRPHHEHPKSYMFQV